MQFFRSVNWSYVRHRLDELYNPVSMDREWTVLEQTKDILMAELSKKETEEVLTVRLYDPLTTYHRYFITVYHIEHVRILKMQLMLLEHCCNVVRQIQQGIPQQKAAENISARELHFLRHYLSTLPK